MILRGLSAFAIAVLVVGCFCYFWIGFAGVGVRSQDWFKTIQSILQRGDTFIASTRDGIYQASLTEKVWRKMPTPISMPLGGQLAQVSAVSPRLIYYTGNEFGTFSFAKIKGSLFVSEDAGKTWTASSIDQDVLDAFMQPDGSIFAVTQTMVTTSPGENATWTTDANGVNDYPSQHLLVSRDNGHAWKDITPTLRSGFGLYGLFQDPDHPDLVCVSSTMINHAARRFIFQAADETYQWQEFPDEEWLVGHKLHENYFWGMDVGGGGLSATLENFFKFPCPTSGHYPDIPTRYLECEKTAYSFHLNQPMPVSVSTVFMYPDPVLKWFDNKNEKVFWGLKIKPEGSEILSADPRSIELDVDRPDPDKMAAYLHDPDLMTVEVDLGHPYQRVVDLGKLYHFSQIGHYQLQIFHSDLYLEGHGSCLGTGVIEVSVVP